MSAAAGAAFTGAALVIAAPTDAQSAGDDAELLAALAEFDALELRIFPPGWSGPQTDEEEDAREVLTEPWRARQKELLGRICDLRAVTPEGWQARARSFVAWDDGTKYDVAQPDDPSGYVDERLILALLRDLAGGTAA